MKKLSSRIQILKIVLVVMSIVFVVSGFYGLVQIYNNNKTDGLNNGQITVDSCKEKDWARRVYSCTGDYFSTGGGMFERKDVSVEVYGEELKKGDIVKDVYSPNPWSVETTEYFVTGRERASVAFNMAPLVLAFAGIVMPLITIFFFLLHRHYKNTNTRH